jgi:hypothetical protein
MARTWAVKALLANPRWEKRLLKFLELTGVGKIVDGVNEEETRATRMDEWIAWEMGEGGGPSALIDYPFSFLSVFSSISFLSRELIPRVVRPARC